MNRLGAYGRRLLRLIASGDVAGIGHRLRCLAGRRRPVPFPDLESLLPELRRRDERLGAPAERKAERQLLAVTHNLDREGASISLFDLIHGLLAGDPGLAVEVVSFTAGPLAEDYRRAGIQVRMFDPRLADLSTVPRLEETVGRLARIVRGSGADVVLANTLLCFPAILAAARAGVRSVWVPRESEPWDRYFQFLPDAVAQRAVAAVGVASSVVFVARATRKVWQAFDRWGDFRVIHNALRLERYRGRGDPNFRGNCRQELMVGDDELVVLNVGTICERKGQADLVEAAALLSRRSLPTRLRVMLLGDDRESYAKRLRLRVDALREGFAASGNVEFRAPASDVSRYYAAADLFVLCSRVESHPRVVLEAMAYGLPVVSTRAFGVVEQVVEGQGAHHYEAGDAVALAEHIARLAEDPAHRQAMARASAARFEDLETFAEMVALYRSVVWPAVDSASLAAAI